MGLFIDFGRGRACASGNETTAEQELRECKSARTSDSEGSVKCASFTTTAALCVVWNERHDATQSKPPHVRVETNETAWKKVLPAE